MNSVFIFSNKYDIHSLGLNFFHPFDGKKFSRAWKYFRSLVKKDIASRWIEPEHPVSEQCLLKVHSQAYLSSLKQSVSIAKVIEVPIAKFLPNNLLQSYLLNPIKVASYGTILAIEAALERKLIAMNFGGGYHHAFPEHGEGFCFFADAGLALKHAREKGLLELNDKVLMIDLDAHRGNGFESLSLNDPAVASFDMYNFQVYPGLHDEDSDKSQYMIPLKSGMQDHDYLEILHRELDAFLKQHEDAKCVFYNAGSDILDGDPLGGLNVSFEGVFARDHYVVGELVKRELPTIVMTSGGYTGSSHRLIAELANTIFQLTND